MQLIASDEMRPYWVSRNALSEEVVAAGDDPDRAILCAANVAEAITALIGNYIDNDYEGRHEDSPWWDVGLEEGKEGTFDLIILGETYRVIVMGPIEKMEPPF